jgi:hypothetical protein
LLSVEKALAAYFNLARLGAKLHMISSEAPHGSQNNGSRRCFGIASCDDAAC